MAAAGTRGVALRPCAAGRGAFAAEAARKGVVFATEAPYAAVQTLGSRRRALACAHCLSPLGPLAAAVAAATQAGGGARALAAAQAVALSAAEQPDGGGGPLPPLPGHEPPPATACACARSCGALFCAPACRDAAGWHALLCDGQLGGAHPLAEFRRHAERTSESYLLAARALATGLAAAVAAGGAREAVDEAAATLKGFGHSAPWWEVSAAALAGPEPPPGDAAGCAAHAKRVKRLRRALREQLEESHQLLSVGLQHRHRLSAAQYAPLLDFEFFDSLAAAVELCVVPIAHEATLTRYCRALAAAPRAEQQRALEALQPVVDAAALRVGVVLDDQGEVDDAEMASDAKEEEEEEEEEEANGGGKRARTGDGIFATACGAKEQQQERTIAGGASILAVDAPASAASGVRWGDAPERVAASLATLAPAVFDGVEGVALGATFSGINHSCVPNCQFETAPGGALALVPLCDVAGGAELTAAFTATAAPLATRRAELRRRRIVCACARCALDAAAANGPQALAAALAAMPPPALLALGRQAQEEGRHVIAVQLFAALQARSDAAAAGVEAGEAAHAAGVSQLALGRWSDAHATWAAGARAAPRHPALQAQAAKDRSYWPAPGAPCSEDSLADAPNNAEDAFVRVPIGGGADAVVTTAPLLDAAGCARLVAAAEAAAAGAGGWTTARHYDVPTTDLPLHSVPPLLAWFNAAMRRSIAPLLACAFPGCVGAAARLRVHDAFVVRYSAAAQRHLPVHRDQSVLSLTIALNPRAEFQGGGTYFAEARAVVCPDAGHVVAFSGEARHGGEPITAGVRYIIAAFLYLADE